MDTTQLRELLAAPQSLVVLASGDAEGAPNLAVFGSTQVLEDGRVMLALADNRTWENLQQNRRAALLVCQPAEHLLAWRGVRAYLELDGAESQGALFEQLRASVEQHAGALAARMVQRAVLFRVVSLRPLLDMPRPQRSRGARGAE